MGRIFPGNHVRERMDGFHVDGTRKKKERKKGPPLPPLSHVDEQ